jgi:hypothetical protein
MYFTGILLLLDCADATRAIVARSRLVYSRSQQSFNGLELRVEAAYSSETKTSADARQVCHQPNRFLGLQEINRIAAPLPSPMNALLFVARAVKNHRQWGMAHRGDLHSERFLAWPHGTVSMRRWM